MLKVNAFFALFCVPAALAVISPCLLNGLSGTGKNFVCFHGETSANVLELDNNALWNK